MQKKILLVVNEDRFFLSHRKEIALGALEEGWDVTVVAKDTGHGGDIMNMGLKFINLPVNPTGMNILEEAFTIKFLYNLYRENPHAVIHHVGLKNILWGSIAARMAPTLGVVNAVSGLGTLFGEDGHSSKLSKMIQKALKLGMHKHNIKVIFQNKVDLKLFLENDIVRKEDVEFIKGSGVDLDEFCHTPPPSYPPVRVIFTARMLREKGVEDLAAAAELLRSEYQGKVEFLLVGGLSSNPKAMKAEDMERLADGKYIKWMGHRDNISTLLKQSHIMAFPSYYREGLPKSLIEANAIGRPIVTTDSIGCQDTVIDGVNGFLVPTHSPGKIAEKLRILIDRPDLRSEMGNAARKFAEDNFDVNKVVERHLKIYEELLANAVK